LGAGPKGSDRPFVMGRWPGHGGHRYPIGFVGDTYSRWEVGSKRGVAKIEWQSMSC
jgi:hypothetical protein